MDASFLYSFIFMYRSSSTFYFILLMNPLTDIIFLAVVKFDEDITLFVGKVVK